MRRDDEGGELEPEHGDPEDLGPELVFPDGQPDTPGRRLGHEPDQSVCTDQESQRQPVEVAGTDHAGQHTRHAGRRHHQTGVAARQAVRIILDQVVASLGERQRHHGKRDPASLETESPERHGKDEADGSGKAGGWQQRPAPV